MTDSLTFASLGLRDEITNALRENGYENPTPIQAQAIPVVLEGRDLLGQAATGTGKTAAFALPVLEKLADLTRNGKPRALVLTPTRELAMQVAEATRKYGKPIGARVLAVYGGEPIWKQMKDIDRGVDIIVATPGRTIDLVKRGSLDLSDIAIVVLDEADEMLDMGFAEEIEEVLKTVPKERQTLLFSATLPARINAIAARHQTNPERIKIAKVELPEGEKALVRQMAYVVSHQHKVAAVARLVEVERPAAALVFCRTRDEVDTVTEALNQRGYRAEALHGGMDQSQRDRVMTRLRNETADLLVATDVAARGLDIDHLTHVINYDVPSSPEIYVHRIGRVGRAGRQGVAITMVKPNEQRNIPNIERVTKTKIEIATLPTVDDVTASRANVLRTELETMIEAGGLEDIIMVAKEMSEDHDMAVIAAAAIKMAMKARGLDQDEKEIPEAKSFKDDRGSRGNDRGENRNGPRGGGASGKGRPSSAGMTRIFVGAGKSANIQPKDLVGAIANETSLSGKDIGSIQIQDRFSLVEVPEKSVDEVLSALTRTTIKGKKTSVRRERF